MDNGDYAATIGERLREYTGQGDMDTPEELMSGQRRMDTIVWKLLPNTG